MFSRQKFPTVLFLCNVFPFERKLPSEYCNSLKPSSRSPSSNTNFERSGTSRNRSIAHSEATGCRCHNCRSRHVKSLLPHRKSARRVNSSLRTHWPTRRDNRRAKYSPPRLPRRKSITLHPLGLRAGFHQDNPRLQPEPRSAARIPLQA